MGPGEVTDVELIDELMRRLPAHYPTLERVRNAVVCDGTRLVRFNKHVFRVHTGVIPSTDDQCINCGDPWHAMTMFETCRNG